MPQRKKRATLKDVAKHAGVSVKTASNVKNDWPYVSEETRAKVKQAMSELGYRPSQVARSLKTGRSQTIGVIVPDVTNPFFATAFRGCEDALAAQGYSTFLCNTDENLKREIYYLDMLIKQGVDGILLWGSRAETHILQEHPLDQLPVVSVDGLSQDGIDNFTFIRPDNFGGAQQIVNHLIQNGLRDIIFISGASHRLPAQQRLEGFKAALEAADISWDESRVVNGAPSISGGYAITRELLASRQPQALFCYNDLMAIGAMAAIEEYGGSVPDDIAVVGFDDIVPASLVTPYLTTVRISQYQLGQYAADQLLNRFENPELPSQIVEYPVELVIRNSCGTQRMSLDERSAMMRQLTK